eukprot:9445727-Pyramimonas_sp.AAC.2
MQLDGHVRDIYVTRRDGSSGVCVHPCRHWHRRTRKNEVMLIYSVSRRSGAHPNPAAVRVGLNTDVKTLLSHSTTENSFLPQNSMHAPKPRSRDDLASANLVP